MSRPPPRIKRTESLFPYKRSSDVKGATEENPLDNQVIRKKLQAMNGVDTVWGPISFSDRGRVASAGLPVIQWQGKDPELQVVYPENLATSKAIYPEIGRASSRERVCQTM